jgi:hypothetical protein
VDSFSEPVIAHVSLKSEAEQRRPRPTSPSSLASSSSIPSMMMGSSPPSYPHAGLGTHRGLGAEEMGGASSRARSPYMPPSMQGLRGFNFTIRVSKAASRSLGCSIVGGCGAAHVVLGSGWHFLIIGHLTTPFPMHTDFTELPDRVHMRMPEVENGIYIEWLDPDSDLGWRYGLRVFDRVSYEPPKSELSISDGYRTPFHPYCRSPLIFVSCSS